MKLDNIDYFSADKLQKVIEERFGQSIKLSEMEDSTLDLFKQSVEQSIQTFERSMGFNSGAQNPKYLENKLLADAIIKEQESRMKVSRVQGDEIEMTDPNKPGVKTVVNKKEVDVDVDDQGNVKVDTQNKTKDVQDKNKLKPGQQVTVEDLDQEAMDFIEWIQDKGYKITSQGAGPKGISIEYQDRDGNTHTVDFKDSKVTREEEGDLEDTVAPEFKKLVHDMQQGMSKQELEKKYPNNKEEIEQLTKDLATIAEHITMAVRGQLSEASYRLGGKELAALRLLVGNENFTMAKRALEMAKSGQSIPASLMKGFMPVIEKLDTFIKGGASAVTRFNNLQKVVGRNESKAYADTLKSLLENEMETSEILLASQDIVDQITDMYEKIAELKSSTVLELVDRMSDEMGQEQASSYQNQINPTLEALEQALSTARQGAQDSVAIVKGEAPQPMAGDGDIDTGADADMDMDIDTGDDMGGDADIEGGDDFGASEPAAGGEEPAGRAER